MPDNDSYLGTCHNHYPMLMLHSRSVSVHLTYYRRFVMVMTVLDDTFDVWPVLRVLHKIVAANHCYWAFDTDRLVLVRPSNKPVVLSDAKYRRASHRNVTAKQLMLQVNQKQKSFDVKH